MCGTLCVGGDGTALVVAPAGLPGGIVSGRIAAAIASSAQSGPTLRNCNKKDRDIDLTIPITPITGNRFVSARKSNKDVTFVFWRRADRSIKTHTQKENLLSNL